LPTNIKQRPLFFTYAALKHIRGYIDELQGYVVNFGINVLCMLRHIIGVNCSLNINNITEEHSVLIIHGSLLSSPKLYNYQFKTLTLFLHLQVYNLFLNNKSPYYLTNNTMCCIQRQNTKHNTLFFRQDHRFHVY